MNTLQDLRHTPTLLSDPWRERARLRMRTSRAATMDRLWSARVAGLEHIDTLLRQVPDWAFLSHFKTTAEHTVEDRLRSLTNVPIDDYDVLNAKAVIRAVRGLSARTQLLRVQRYEEQHKARKTVLRTITDLLQRLPPMAGAIA